MEPAVAAPIARDTFLQGSGSPEVGLAIDLHEDVGTRGEKGHEFISPGGPGGEVSTPTTVLPGWFNLLWAGGATSLEADKLPSRAPLGLTAGEVGLISVVIFQRMEEEVGVGTGRPFGRLRVAIFGRGAARAYLPARG